MNKRLTATVFLLMSLADVSYADEIADKFGLGSDRFQLQFEELTGLPQSFQERGRNQRRNCKFYSDPNYSTK
jgi:hypothetical protein